ncbi:hypothetical protein BHE74_00022512 [Ensete ventricosum]|nr:hypothetical protein GW17_00022229 [Ensete ventricosum]RWW69852.1 hypothetical protein BHE74_00022512 [Ensete ventricosum]RZR99380.1 hypothetical protein BHM03_00028896 [Ensete ventricosum]
MEAVVHVSNLVSFPFRTMCYRLALKSLSRFYCRRCLLRNQVLGLFLLDLTRGFIR